MVGLHVEKAGHNNFGELVYPVVFDDNFFSRFDHSLDVKKENRNRSGKDQKEEKKNEREFLLDTVFKSQSYHLILVIRK